MRIRPPAPDSAVDPTDSLATRQVDAMVSAWSRGERPLAEDFLALHPELGDEAAIRLIFEEFCLRREAGLEVDPAEIARRFPEWRAELEVLLDCQRMMEPDPSPVLLPVVGDVLAGFRLRAELGRGGSGRVFLATEPDLADRPVALKITPRGREEHLALAQLQHMNIVPLYSARVLQDRDLLVLCMPYLGGASLAQVVEELKEIRPSRRTGRDLVEALDRLQARQPIAPPARGPFREHLAEAPYVEAIAWIGACLADGLQFAHKRGLIHMDVKPSNVLIAGDGQPMLLDFHVARGPIAPGEPTPTWIGGTLESIAPEHRAALDAVREGRTVPRAVDGRADIYSLGLLLMEVLGGTGPNPSEAPCPPIHRSNPKVSVGLSDIIEKCLKPDPGDRYPDAASLASDLRRHLNDLALRWVPNRSRAERWRKWRRRRPSALPRSVFAALSALMISAALVLSWLAYRQRVEQVEAILADGRAAIDRHQYPEATILLIRGLALSERMPGFGPRRLALAEALARATRDGKAAELHRIAELVRFRYGIDPPPPEEARSLIHRGRLIWESRGLLLRPIGDLRDPEVERGIRQDLLDMMLVWADLRVRSASPEEAKEARREVLALLDEAAAELGPSPAIDRDRLTYTEPDGRALPSLAPTPGPRTAWEHYDLGRSYLRSGKVAFAAEQFQLGLELQPQDFWLNFYQGLCAYRLGRFDDAVGAFRVCIALSPRSAECSYNRALAYEGLGRTDRAIRDYTRALDLDGALTEAAINRGILFYRGGRLADADADLKRALASASDRKARGTIRFNLALIDLGRDDRTSAIANLNAAAELDHREARDLLERLRPRVQ